MQETSIACATCVWFDLNSKGKPSCDAFPDGIPGEILSGKNQHRDAVKGDNGIRWKPVEGFEWLDTPDRIEDFDRDPSLKEADPNKRDD